MSRHPMGLHGLLQGQLYLTINELFHLTFRSLLPAGYQHTTWNTSLFLLRHITPHTIPRLPYKLHMWSEGKTKYSHYPHKITAYNLQKETILIRCKRVFQDFLQVVLHLSMYKHSLICHDSSGVYWAESLSQNLCCKLYSGKVFDLYDSVCERWV
jgi:hypothetical protein